ncbi:MAG TPA: ABC transporter permease [Acidobacteriaceae bacterium]|jgi:predicted permease
MQLVSQLWQDLRYALRQLRRTPGFAITAVLTLALGVGATTAIFTLIYQVMLRPLPVRAPEQLYKLGRTDDCCHNGGGLFGDWSLFSYDLYKQFRDHLSGFESLAAVEPGHTEVGVRRQGGDEAAIAAMQFVSGNYFPMLGAPAMRGRTLQPADDQRGTEPHIVLSYRMWQQRFAGSPEIVGAPLMVNGGAMTVAGIMPPEFYGTHQNGDPTDIWAPLAFEPMLTNIDAMDHPEDHWLGVLGRLRPGVNAATITPQASGLLQQWLLAHQESLAAGQKAAIPQQRTELVEAAAGVSQMRNNYASGLQLLMMIAGFVLLIVCANLANLMLVRGMARKQQTAVRLALGAQRGRLIRQTLIESLVVSLIGSGVAVLFAVAGSHAILAMALGGDTTSPFPPTSSMPVLGFALGVAVLAGMLFGCVPAWITSHFDPIEALRGASRTAGDKTAWPQKMLVVFQAALSLALLSTAGLLILSLHALEHQNLHLATSGRLIVGINPVAAGYDITKLNALERRLDTDLKQVPGVIDAAYAIYSPLSHDRWHDLTHLPGQPPPPPEFTNNYYRTTWDRVSPDFFSAVGTHLLLGRVFTDGDTATTRRVAVVNQAFVDRFLKGKPALGAHFGMDEHDPNELEIVGVVENTKYEHPEEPQLPMVFVPMAQPSEIFKETDRIAEEHSHYPEDIIVHYQGGEAEMAATMRRTLAHIDPNLPITRVDSLQTQVNLQFSQPAMLARLTTAFGLIALLLAAVGIYGVTAYTVERRTPEVGLRMALGADRGDVLREVLKHALSQVLVGLVLGVPLALGLGRLMASHLYQVSSYNLPILSGAFATLILAAVLAAFLPATRAAAIEPVEALRNE